MKSVATTPAEETTMPFFHCRLSNEVMEFKRKVFPNPFELTMKQLCSVSVYLF